MAKIGHDAKANKKPLYEQIRLVVCKKPLQKTPNIRKKEHFENGENWPRRKRNSLCKMVSLDQKFKMPKRCEKKLHEQIRVVVCKKPLQNTPTIQKMRAFSKWPKFFHDA